MPNTAATDRSSSATYYAVVFSSQRAAAGRERMLELAQEQDGFLGVESARGADGFGITISYWRDEQSIARWKANSEHLVAQRKGHEIWYESFNLRVARVEREYAKCAKERADDEAASGNGLRPGN